MNVSMSSMGRGAKVIAAVSAALSIATLATLALTVACSSGPSGTPPDGYKTLAWSTEAAGSGEISVPSSWEWDTELAEISKEKGHESTVYLWEPPNPDIPFAYVAKLPLTALDAFDGRKSAHSYPADSVKSIEYRDGTVNGQPAVFEYAVRIASYITERVLTVHFQKEGSTWRVQMPRL